MGSARSMFRPNGDQAKTNLGHRQARLATLPTRAEPAQELDSGPAGQDQCTPATTLDHVWSGSGQNQKRLAGGLALHLIFFGLKKERKTHTACLALHGIRFHRFRAKKSISQIRPNATPAQNVGGRFLVLFLSMQKESQGDASTCLLYTSPSPRDATLSRMPSSA